MSAQEFSGEQFEFAVGSLQGLRAWNVDDLGRLHGVTHREVWRPGENVSVCKQTRVIPCPNPASKPSLADDAVGGGKRRRNKRDDSDRCPCGCGLTVQDVRSGGVRSLHERPSCGEPTCRDGGHIVGSDHRFDPSCQCGFWAYDEASFAAQGEIVGVIDAYGKTTIGTKGFRAEKARIVGLSRKDREGKPLSRSLVFRLASLYPEVAFHDDLDALIDAHDGVLKSWAEAGDGFWLQPVSEPVSGYSYGGVTFQASSQAFTRSLARLSRAYGGSI